jgi:hypothetical protein
MLYVFFWVIPRRLNFICRHFETLCLFHLHRQVGVKWLNLRTPIYSLEIAWADWKEGDRVGVGPVTKQVMKGVSKSWKPLLHKLKERRQPPTTQQLWPAIPWPTLTHFHIPARGCHIGSLPPINTCFVTGPTPTVTFLPICSGYFRAIDTPTILKFCHFTPTCIWRWNR